MRKLFLFLFMLVSIAMHGQWVITPDGALADSITGKPYMIINRDGVASDLYKEVLKNVHNAFTQPNDVVSTIENEMISVTGYTKTTLKYAGLNGSFMPEISVKIEFKDNRMRVSAFWVKTIWMDRTIVDPYTLLVKGGLKCFDKNGAIKNESRYLIFNRISSDFINRIINAPATEDW